MSARGRFLSGLIPAVITLAGFFLVGALPAAASPPIVQYVALGDSYAAGTAIGSFPNCPHNPDGYPALLDSENRIDLQPNGNATCSGATADEVAETQLSPLDRDTRLVTLTVGAADLGLSSVLAACTAGTVDRCKLAIQEALRGLPTLSSDLAALYTKVAAAAPRARIVVTGYPHLFEPTAAAFVDPGIIIAVNQATDELNAIIERSVGAANEADVNIHYVDVTEEFTGHGIVTPITDLKDPNAFIHSLFTCDPPRPDCQDLEAFHPTDAGYRAYADVISAALPGGWLDKQKQSV
jgi:lysophospholipase L1-like esterase